MTRSKHRHESNNAYQEYLQQVELQKEALIRVLEVGKRTIKEGHRIANLNPDGSEIMVDLTYGQIERRIGELKKLGVTLNIVDLAANVRRWLLD